MSNKEHYTILFIQKNFDEFETINKNDPQVIFEEDEEYDEFVYDDSYQNRYQDDKSLKLSVEVEIKLSRIRSLTSRPSHINSTPFY